MTDHPILFNTPMIRALLREIEAPGTGKTQTRRGNHLLRLRRFGSITGFGRSDTAGYDWHFRDRGMRWHDLHHARLLTALPWQSGDRLWVRETWGGYLDAPDAEEFEGGVPVFYRADPEDAAAGIDVWRPSIHMPRWSSRLTLYVTEVRVERLQDISETDALAEGIYRVDPTAEDLAAGSTMDDFVFMAPGVRQGWGMTKTDRDRDRWWPNAVGAYRLLWDHIYGAGSWDANPWVSVTTFRPVLGNIDGLPATLQEAV